MKENKRRAAFRKGVRRGRAGQGLGIRQIVKIITSTVRCVVWCLLNAILSLWDLNPVSVAIRRWRKSQPKQASIALTVRPRFRDLIGDWFLSYEGRKRKLLQWVHSMLPWLSEDVMDFGPSWQDGIVLCALMDTLNPGSCMQVHLLKPHHRVNNCRLGIQLAMTYLEISQATLSPEEMSLAEEGTEIKLVQLVQLVRWHFLKQGSKVKVETNTGSEEPVVPFKCEARGTGIKAGIVGKRTKFNLFVESVKHLHLIIEIKGPNNEYNKETIISMQPRGPSKYSHYNVSVVNTEDEAKSKVVEDGEGHSFLRQKSFDEGPSHLVIPFDYQCVGEGRFLATYIPRNAGLHYITILSHGNHIPGSPFEVKVSDWVSSWNLVPKTRVVPFDMINNYVEGGSKEGAKSTDKCKLSSVASVSRQLTTMRRRILKKVITQGGREIIVKQSGGIPIDSPSKLPEGAGCSHHVNGSTSSKLATINEGYRTNGDIKDEGKRAHNPLNPAWRCPGHAICNPTVSSKPIPSTGPTSNNCSLTDTDGCAGNLMDDFKNVKMDVSDKWKIAALKVSINEMANKCEDSSLTTNTPVLETDVGEIFHTTTANTPHNISIKITHCDSRESLGTPITPTSPSSFESTAGLDAEDSDCLPSSGRDGNGNTPNQSDLKSSSVAKSRNDPDMNLDKSIDQHQYGSTSDLPDEASKPETNTKDNCKDLPLQRWSFLRENYFNYLRTVNSGKDDINSTICQICGKELTSSCTCCVDSGNESGNQNCEETDGDESSLFGFDVDAVTESSIDSEMGQFQNYFNHEMQSRTLRGMNQQKKQTEQHRHSWNIPGRLQQRSSFVSFRKEDDQDSDILFTESNLNDWKTLRKAQSFSEDCPTNGDRRKVLMHRQSQSFDSSDFDKLYCGNVTNDIPGQCNIEYQLGETQENNRCDEYPAGVENETRKASNESHKVSIIKNSKMVKSIFYIKAKANDKTLRSYSLPETYSPDANGDSQDHEKFAEMKTYNNAGALVQDTKHDRFASVKKAWKSFDADILDLLNNSKDYMEFNTSNIVQPVERKRAEISLKLPNEINSLSTSDLNAAENDEILEVVIENDIISDGFATENDDEESVVPTTPTSIKIESGLSSMKTSPVNGAPCQDVLRCPECFETLYDSRHSAGLSPLSIEMNKSDNSDWSDEISPEIAKGNIGYQAPLKRNYSPQIMDLPRFPATRSPIRSPTMALSPSLTLPGNYYATTSTNSCQYYKYDPHLNMPKIHQQPNYLDDSDILTEDSSISGSVSGEDGTKDGFMFEIPTTAFMSTKGGMPMHFMKSAKSTTEAISKMTPEPKQMHSSVIVSVRSPSNSSKMSSNDESIGRKGSPVSPALGNELTCVACQRVEYCPDRKNEAISDNIQYKNPRKKSGKEHFCHCLCQNIPKSPSENKCYLVKRRHGVTNDVTRYHHDTSVYPLSEIEDGTSDFVEKEIIPTKYKSLPATQIDNMSSQHTPLEKEFHWDSQAGSEHFVERTLTPTKYRKQIFTDVSDSVFTVDSITSPDGPRGASSEFKKHNDFKSNSASSNDNEKVSSMVCSSNMNEDDILFDSSMNIVDRDIGFRYFMHQMMIAGDSFTQR